MVHHLASNLKKRRAAEADVSKSFTGPGSLNGTERIHRCSQGPHDSLKYIHVYETVPQFVSQVDANKKQ